MDGWMIDPMSVPEMQALKCKNGGNMVCGLTTWSGNQCTYARPGVTPLSMSCIHWTHHLKKDGNSFHLSLWSTLVLSVFLILAITMQGDYFTPFYRWGNSWISLFRSPYMADEEQSSGVLAVLLRTPNHGVPCPFCSLTPCASRSTGDFITPPIKIIL